MVTYFSLDRVVPFRDVSKSNRFLHPYRLMIKRAQGRKNRIGFTFRRFKKRFFCLTTKELFYSKSKAKQPLCRIPITDILAVEKLQEESFKMKYVSVKLEITIQRL